MAVGIQGSPSHAWQLLAIHTNTAICGEVHNTPNVTHMQQDRLILRYLGCSGTCCTRTVAETHDASWQGSSVHVCGFTSVHLCHQEVSLLRA